MTRSAWSVPSWFAATGPDGTTATSLLDQFALAIAVRRERRTLSGLSERELKDIGLSRADVECEISRPMWDLPGRQS
jgi:uncharacterized protein YjiS (DUF1127 family)